MTMMTSGRKKSFAIRATPSYSSDELILRFS
jgi:hypothetical protein